MGLRTVADPAVLAGLTGRLERLTVEERRIWGKMTAHQMAVHLADAADAALGRRPFSATARRPNRVLWLVSLHLPVPWPRGVRTGANPAGTILSAATFEADRRRAIASLGELASASTLATHHPIFGPMTPANWHRWAFLHVDHHLRQFGL
jgi:hypothetical protein